MADFVDLCSSDGEEESLLPYSRKRRSDTAASQENIQNSQLSYRSGTLEHSLSQDKCNTTKRFKSVSYTPIDLTHSDAKSLGTRTVDRSVISIHSTQSGSKQPIPPQPNFASQESALHDSPRDEVIIELLDSPLKTLLEAHSHSHPLSQQESVHDRTHDNDNSDVHSTQSTFNSAYHYSAFSSSYGHETEAKPSLFSLLSSRVASKQTSQTQQPSSQQPTSHNNHSSNSNINNNNSHNSSLNDNNSGAVKTQRKTKATKPTAASSSASVSASTSTTATTTITTTITTTATATTSSSSFATSLPTTAHTTATASSSAPASASTSSTSISASSSALASVSGSTASSGQQDVALGEGHLRVARGSASDYEVRLLVDRRERANNLVLASLQTLGVRCEAANLAVGDFLFVARRKAHGLYAATESQAVLADTLVLDHVVVERKAVADLAASLLDGRFSDQKRRLKMTRIRRCVVLVEGESLLLPPQLSRVLSVQHLKTAMANAFADHDLHVVRTRNMDHSIAFLRTLHRQVSFAFEQQLQLQQQQHQQTNNTTNTTITFMSLRHYQDTYRARSADNLSELFGQMLRQVAGCGASAAHAIVSRYGTLAHFVWHMRSIGRLNAQRELEDLHRRDEACAASSASHATHHQAQMSVSGGGGSRLGAALARRILSVALDDY